MKLGFRAILILFLLSFGLAAEAQSISTVRIQEIPQLFKDPRAFLLSHPDFMKSQLSFAISRRCRHYVDKDQEQCGNAANQLVKDLNIEAITLEDPTSHVKTPYIVTFSQELKDLHADPRTPLFLNELKENLDRVEEDTRVYQFIAPQNIKPFDIGRLAMKYYGSFPNTLKALAALLQDLPKSEIQVHYLYQLYGADPIVRDLHSIVSRIGRLSLPDGSIPILLFNKKFYNSLIYHALVPAYLSTRLFAKNYPLKTAFFTAFAFNYIYEAGEEVGDLKTMFVEPKSLKNPSTQNDIRAGEFGALLGISQSQKFLAGAEARALLATSPKSYLLRLISNLN